MSLLDFINCIDMELNEWAYHKDLEEPKYVPVPVLTSVPAFRNAHAQLPMLTPELPNKSAMT